jgi:glycosyltransferase involved in cell wall biosynthesis
MRILLCSPNPLDRELGAPKVLLELADALRAQQCEVDLLAPDQLGLSGAVNFNWRREYSRRLAELIRDRSATLRHDVIDYDHMYLPFARDSFPREVLMVARSVLLVHNTLDVPVRHRRGLVAVAAGALRDARRQRERKRYAGWANVCVAQADLVNVCNEHERAELMRRGTPAAKIVVLPFGMSCERRRQFVDVCAVEPPPPARPVVAFVGTFDPRKGSEDFPGLVDRVRDAIPDVRFRLLGTRGMYPSAEQVLACFATAAREHVQVVPHYRAAELPRLLADCSAGIFPSYAEGFPFGVLEMLAAAIPVIAYDAPGAPMMLGRDWLVPAGDVPALSRRLINLLRDPSALALARRDARRVSERFDWSTIARRTLDAYSARLDELRAPAHRASEVTR